MPIVHIQEKNMKEKQKRSSLKKQSYSTYTRKKT